MRAKMALGLAALIFIVASVFPLYPAMVSAGSPDNHYYAYPILTWDVTTHRATFGVRFIAGNALNLTYYGKIWIQFYYQDTPGSKTMPQLLYQTNASISEFAVAAWNLNQKNLTWEKPYTFTKWSDGKHDLIVNLNWIDNRNSTNWSNLDGNPMAPYNVYNGSAWIHHLDWTETVNFTAPPPPQDNTGAAVVIGGFFLFLIVGSVISEVAYKIRKLRRRRHTKIVWRN